MKKLILPLATLSAFFGCSTTRPDPMHITGWKDVPFRASETALKQAWTGQPLMDTADDHSACHLLRQRSSTQNFGIAFMVEDGEFVRYEVDDAAYQAPGKLAVGSTAEDVRRVFGDTLTRQPDKYDPTMYQLWVPPNSADVSLVFIFDQSDRVIRWRAGVPPAVFYVENCG